MCMIRVCVYTLKKSGYLHIPWIFQGMCINPCVFHLTINVNKDNLKALYHYISVQYTYITELLYVEPVKFALKNYTHTLFIHIPCNIYAIQLTLPFTQKLHNN